MTVWYAGHSDLHTRRCYIQSMVTFDNHKHKNGNMYSSWVHILVLTKYGPHFSWFRLLQQKPSRCENTVKPLQCEKQNANPTFRFDIHYMNRSSPFWLLLACQKQSKGWCPLKEHSWTTTPTHTTVIPAQVSTATTFIVPQFILGSCVMLYIPQMMISQHPTTHY